MQVLKSICALIVFSASLVGQFQETTFEQDVWDQLKMKVSMDPDYITLLNNKLAQLGYKSSFNTSDANANALFAAYPTLQSKIPYISLGALPTPVEKLHTLSKRYNTHIYIKQDSLSGGKDAQGMPLYGGNKVRKLEFLLAQAQVLGATKVLTFGCVGSNHAVATAVHARRLGMEPICMLKPQPPSYAVQHNLLMHLHYNSELHYSPNNDIRNLHALTVWLEHYKKDGQVPYIIPTGGSNKYGTLGFVNAAFELVAQINQGLMPRPTHIYIPCGSCATVAGMLLGCKAAGLQVQIIAVVVEPDQDPTFAQTVGKLFKETNAYVHALDASFPVCAYTQDDLILDHHFAGTCYGMFTQEGVNAAREMHEAENIILDGTYTAKAFACLLSDVKKQPERVVLFWNTYSGLDFSQHITSQDFTQLPQCLHAYFDEKNIQPLDAD